MVVAVAKVNSLVVLVQEQESIHLVGLVQSVVAQDKYNKNCKYFI